jgi:hypothetical protein
MCLFSCWILFQQTFYTIVNTFYVDNKQDFMLHLYMFFHGCYAIGFVMSNQAFMHPIS